VSSRERRRAELRKRKARRAVPAEATVGAEHPGGEVPVRPEPPLRSRSVAKDDAAREALEPLEQGERPKAVTIGAAISALIALSVVIAYAAGSKVDGHRPHVAQIIAPAFLMGMMAYGMWRARYWAVLGFQVVLLFLILISAKALVVEVSTVFQGLAYAVILAGSGVLFYKMIKAMARIQMPERK
jgi:hypothetical protein